MVVFVPRDSADRALDREALSNGGGSVSSRDDRLEFDTAYWLEGGDTAKVEYSTDDGQSWSTLGSELRKAEQIQDPDPAHWIWHEGWYDPDMGGYGFVLPYP